MHCKAVIRNSNKIGIDCHNENKAEITILASVC